MIIYHLFYFIDFKSTFSKINGILGVDYSQRNIKAFKDLTSYITTSFELLKLFPLTPEIVNQAIETMNMAMSKCAYNLQK